MLRTVLARASALAFLFASAWMAYTQSPPAKPQLKIDKIKDDLYVIAMAEGVGGGNVAMEITNEGVILIDDMFDRNYGEIMAKVKSVTSQPVKYVINTHQHDDHSGGNARFLPTAEVIGHSVQRSNMARLNQPGAARVTYTQEMDLFLGGKEVRARHYGRGHTGGDAVIYFPAEKVIHTGDLFLTFPPQPFIDYANGGSALDWTGTIDNILKLDFDTAIPGHGPVSNRAGIGKFRADFVTMRDRVTGMVRQGKPKDDIAHTLSADFGWKPGGLALDQLDAFIAEVKR